MTRSDPRENASRFGRLLCRLGRHTGQAQGGTMMFTCPRCKRSLWQPLRHRDRLRAVETEADLRLASGDHSAVDWAHDEVARITEGR